MIGTPAAWGEEISCGASSGSVQYN